MRPSYTKKGGSMDAKTNHDRLLRAIRTLQLLQRTNDPQSSVAKAVTKALSPLLKEMATPVLTLTGNGP
jgi:hypothetical protein